MPEQAKKTARKRGRPEHKPTATLKGQVSGMAMLGLPHADIAELIGISENTLRKHYKTELDHAGQKADLAVLANFYNIAKGSKKDAKVSDEVRAGMFWMRVRRQWAPATAQPGEGSGGATPIPGSTKQMHEMSDAELEALARG